MWEVSVMKQIRKISNLIAEELESAGFDVNDAAFEEKVSEIVSMISESVKEQAKDADKKDAGNTDVFEDDEDDELIVSEDSKFYVVGDEVTIGDITVSTDQYIEIEDADDGTLILSVYDEDGELIDSDINVTAEDIKDIFAHMEELEVEDDEDVDEAKINKISFKGGKKHKLTPNQIKKKRLAAAGRLKKGFKFVDGKQVKMSAAERRARKKLGKKLAKMGKAKRKKNLLKAKKFAKKVNDGFDISSNGTKISVEEGDILMMEDGLLSVLREGKPVISGVKVSENFLDRCVAEGVASEEDEELEECGDNCKKGEDDKVDEASFLTFKAGKGYVVIKEGTERPIGNRIRARACLRNEGFDITTDMLDRASEGKMVVL